MNILETKTSRIYHHITNSNNWAIVSPYRSEYSQTENEQRMTKLKLDVRKLNYGFIQFVSRWVENGEAFDEESLLIPKMTENDAIELGKKYEQSSVIVCSDGNAREICTTPFETYNSGDIVRTFNLTGDKPLNIKDAEEIFAKRKGGPVSKPKRGKAKPFTLKEVYECNLPKASTFNSNKYLVKIFESYNQEDIIINDIKRQDDLTYNKYLVMNKNIEWLKNKIWENISNSFIGIYTSEDKNIITDTIYNLELERLGLKNNEDDK